MADQRTRRRILRATGLATTVGFTGTGHAETQEPADDTDFTMADVMYVRMMIPHHEGAIQMAELVPARTDREELLDLRPEIIEAQDAEIESLCELLEDAGVAGCDEVGSTMPHEMGEMMRDDGMGPGMGAEDMEDGTDPDEMDQGMHPDEMAAMMPREHMLTHEDRRELRRAEDEAFDCLFVEHMIRHHEGALAMSEYVLEDGDSDRVADLAADIIDAQEAEIETMEEWSEEWDC